ncbi:MAG: hypothetical protein IPN17_08560 [Deltaproteobacteria bacterium]|nr:hypothetical protein [Deltaproteobacteria bacterium]
MKFDQEQFETLSLDEPRRSVATRLQREPASSPPPSATASPRASSSACRRRRSLLQGVSADVDVEIVRNPQQAAASAKVNVTLHTKLPADHPALTSCLATFEDFCIVTQSVRGGIDVAVKVQADG